MTASLGWRLFAQHYLGEHRLFWVDECAWCDAEQAGLFDDAYGRWAFESGLSEAVEKGRI